MKVMKIDLVVTSASDQICDSVQWPRPGGASEDRDRQGTLKDKSE